MKNLKQLVHVVKRVMLNPSDIITKNQSPSTKVSEFYQNIISGAFETDEDASLYFYNASPNNSSYKNLKSSLKTRLINTLFFWEADKNYSEREKAYIYCFKHVAIAKQLIFLNIRGVGIDFCQRVLKKALYYEFTEIIIDVCYYLRAHSVSWHGDLKQFNYYNDLIKSQMKVREAELLANELFLKITLPYVNNKAIKSDTKQTATESFEQLGPYLASMSSPFLHYMTYYIQSLIYITENDYVNTVKVCKKATTFFEQKAYVYKTAFQAFLHQEVLCFTQLKQYLEGKNAVERSLSLLREGSYNWYVNLSLYITLALHSKEYQESYRIFCLAMNHKQFKRTPQRVKERWQIFEMYIHFLITINKIEQSEDDNRFTKIKMGKFLNSVPLFSKDKRGLNIPILVIQIIFMLVRKDYDQANARIEAIEKYCSRYLNKKHNFRSNCFIKMLLQIPISDFHKAGIQRRVEKYQTQLQSVALEIANQSHEIEIIPYEDLWEIIMDTLDTKFYYKKDRARKN